MWADCLENVGSSTSQKPYRPPRPLTGIASFLTHCRTHIAVRWEYSALIHIKIAKMHLWTWPSLPLSVCPHVTTPEQPDKLPWSFKIRGFSKIYQHITILVKICGRGLIAKLHVKYMLCSRVDSDLGRNTYYPNVLRSSPQPTETKAMRSPQIMPKPYFSTSFPIDYGTIKH
jgi:hypothetical protein